MNGIPVTGFRGGPVPAETERAFRRGFHHGTNEILVALEEGASIKDIRRYVAKLHDWRFTEQHYPPNDVVQNAPPELAKSEAVNTLWGR